MRRKATTKQILMLQMHESGLKRQICPREENPIDIYSIDYSLKENAKYIKVSSQIGGAFLRFNCLS